MQQSVHLLLDVIFMGGLGWGLHGAALATLLGDVAGLGLIWGIYYPAGERTLRFIRQLGSREFWEKGLALVRAGLPAALGMGLVAVKVWFLYRIVAWAGGTDGVTIYTACMYYLIFLSMFSNGINQSLLPVLSLLYGEKDYQSVRMLMRYVCRFTMRIVGISVIFALLFPQELLLICKLPAEMAAQGANDVRLFSLSFFGEAWSFLMLYYYSAVGRRTAGNLLSMTTGFFAVIPAAWLFAQFWRRTGVWLGLIFAGLAGVAVEMACQLEQAGEEVRHLFMLDSHAITDEKIRQMARTMFSLTDRDYFENCPLFEELREGGLLEAIIQNYLHVARDTVEHEPSFFHGPVTYFKPEEVPAGQSEQALAYWKKMMEFDAGGYEHFCDREHLQIIHTPHEHDLMMDEASLDIIVPAIYGTIMGGKQNG